ncbi:MAG: hypothetical protein HWN66_05840 [Candidatus Helarchaeota archaeon]|nr:hypothetical protein [Candidatus Helarchaeota archaeon]
MITRRKLLVPILIAVITIGILVPVLLRRGPSDDTIYYTGDTDFTTSLIVGANQKVVFRNGEFNFTGGANLTVFGMLTMLNVIFHGDLTALANGIVLLDTTTVNSTLTFEGNSIGTIQNAEIRCEITAKDSAIVSINNSEVTSLVSYTSALIAVQDCWATDLTLDGDALITATNLSISNDLDTYGQVVAQLDNVTVTNDFISHQNSNVTLTNAAIIHNLDGNDASKLTLVNVTIGWNSLFYQTTEVSMIYCSIAGSYYYSSCLATLTNVTSTDIMVLYGGHVNIINSSVGQIIPDGAVSSNGVVTIDNNIISGTGSYRNAGTYTLINSTYTALIPLLWFVGGTSTANATINNSNYGSMGQNGFSNTTIDNSTIDLLRLYDSSFAVILPLSYITVLELYDTSDYYNSTPNIGTIWDFR